jgi:hypothetical protein
MHISLKTVSSTSIHLAADDRMSFFFLEAKLYSLCINKFNYPPICRWASRLILCLGYCKLWCNKHGNLSLCYADFISFRYIPRSAIAKSHVLVLVFFGFFCGTSLLSIRDCGKFTFFFLYVLDVILFCFLY